MTSSEVTAAPILDEAARQRRAAHPLLRSYDSLRQDNNQFGLLVDDPQGKGWVTLSDLLDPAQGELVRLVDQLGAHHKIEGRSAPAVYFFGGYTYVVIAMSAACYMAFQRVPLPDLSDVQAQFDENSHIQGIAVQSWRFAALPDDPDADHPDCMVVADVEALRAILRDHLTAHLEPLLLATHQATRAGKPAMWAIAGDYVAYAFGWVGKGRGDEAAGVAEANRITAPASKLHRDKGYIHVQHCGLEYYMVDRLSCCLHYKSPEGRYCSACPHRPMEERVDLIKGWLETRAKADFAA